MVWRLNTVIASRLVAKDATADPIRATGGLFDRVLARQSDRDR
jgi:hypothetical protein